MKITMLTQETIDRLGKQVPLDTFTEEECRVVEHNAYVANMCFKHESEEKVWEWFRTLIKKDLNMELAP